MKQGREPFEGWEGTGGGVGNGGSVVNMMLVERLGRMKGRTRRMAARCDGVTWAADDAPQGYSPKAWSSGTWPCQGMT